LDHFYDSVLNLILWLILCVTILLAIFLKGIRGFSRQSLHFILVAIFLLVIYDKTVNQRTIVALREGEEVDFSHLIKNSNPAYAIPLRLLQFEVRMHPGNTVPAAFNSWLLINQTDTALLAVNHPVALKRYRLYQNSYKRDPMLQVVSGCDTVVTTFDAKFILNQQEMMICGYNDTLKTFYVGVGSQEYQVSRESSEMIAGQRIQIFPIGTKYTSYIEIADVTGVGILLFFGILYIIVLANNLWWRPAD